MGRKKDRRKRLRKLIRELREEGWTYEDLGAKAGVASTTIHRIETEKGTPRTKTVKKVLMRLEKLTGVEEPVRLGTGFASPFQPRQEERAVTEQYHETMDRIDDIISDDSVATSYKKELIHLIQAALSTILNLIEEK